MITLSHTKEFERFFNGVDENEPIFKVSLSSIKHLSKYTKIRIRCLYKDKIYTKDLIINDIVYPYDLWPILEKIKKEFNERIFKT